jgi:hypothetical protein
MEAGSGDGEVRAVALIALALASAAAAEAPAWKLTPNGLGPVRIGMTAAQVEKALKTELEGEAFDNEGSCIELFPESDELKGSYFMFLDGKLSRISVSEPSKIVTPRGIGVGASADDVRKAYGAGLQAEEHPYLGAPAEYLTFWLKPKKTGVRFETSAQGKVEFIHAGNDSIQLIEGCA